MDFKCVSVLSTEELKNLQREIEKVLNGRRGEETQKIWDKIMMDFRILIDMNAQYTMVTEDYTLNDMYYLFHSKPQWKFEGED